MAKSIFKILKDNQKIQSDLYKSLKEFMLQGGFSKTEVDIFICKNFTLSMAELTEKWNKLHSSNKKELTFCGQVSVLSNKFYRMFGTNASELESLIVRKADTHPTSLRIMNFIKANGVSSEPLEERFSFTIQDYLSEYEPVGDYMASECEKEIQLLKMMDKQNLEAIFSQVDKDKLAYVMRMMRADLILSDVSECERKDKKTREVLYDANGKVSVRKVNNPVINDVKVDLLLRFSTTIPKKLKVMKVDKTNGVFTNETIVKPVDNSYGLNITEEHLILIHEKENEIPFTDEMKADKPEVREQYKNYLLSMTVETDIDEFRSWLSGVNRESFYRVLESLENKGY